MSKRHKIQGFLDEYGLGSGGSTKEGGAERNEASAGALNDLSRNRNLVRSIVEEESDIDSKGILANRKRTESILSWKSENPLEKAIFRGNFAKVQRLVRGGVDLDRPGFNGLTPLMMAVSRGDLELAHYLVKSGAKVNAEGLDGSTPLTLAIAQGDLKMATELISLGADINQVNEADETPLMEALYAETAPEVVFQIVDLLLKCGANPDHKSEETDETPRQIALRGKKSEIVWLFEKSAPPKKPSEMKMHRTKKPIQQKDFIN